MQWVKHVHQVQHNPLAARSGGSRFHVERAEDELAIVAHEHLMPRLAKQAELKSALLAVAVIIVEQPVQRDGHRLEPLARHVPPDQLQLRRGRLRDLLLSCLRFCNRTLCAPYQFLVKRIIKQFVKHPNPLAHAHD